MNVQVEVTWKTLRTIKHSIMVHAHASEKYIHSALMYTTGHIYHVLPIKNLVNQDGEPTTSHKLETSTKPSVSNIRVLLCPCVVRKATAHFDTKELNMHHQTQKMFLGIFIGIQQFEKGYLIYVPSTRKIVYSHDVVFDETFSSTLSYTSRSYSGALAMQPSVLYIPYATSYHEKLMIL